MSARPLVDLVNKRDLLVRTLRQEHGCGRGRGADALKARIAVIDEQIGRRVAHACRQRETA